MHASQALVHGGGHAMAGNLYARRVGRPHIVVSDPRRRACRTPTGNSAVLPNAARPNPWNSTRPGVNVTTWYSTVVTLSVGYGERLLRRARQRSPGVPYLERILSIG